MTKTILFLFFVKLLFVLSACTNNEPVDRTILIEPGLYKVEGTVATGPLSDNAPNSEQCIGFEQSKISLKDTLEQFETLRECKTYNYRQGRDQYASNYSCTVKEIGKSHGVINFKPHDFGYKININGTITVQGKRYPLNIYINAKRLGDCTIEN